MFGYIPDPINIGTIFVNGISNILTHACNQVDLKLKLKGDQDLVLKMKKVHLGFFKHHLNLDQTDDDFGTLTVNLGSMRSGQDLDILLEFDPSVSLASLSADDFASAAVTYETNGQVKTSQVEKVGVAKVNKSAVLPHLFRYESIDFL